MSEWKKPPVFNAREATERIADLEEKVRKLKEENTNLRIRCRILETDNEQRLSTNQK